MPFTPNAAGDAPASSKTTGSSPDTAPRTCSASPRFLSTLIATIARPLAAVLLLHFVHPRKRRGGRVRTRRPRNRRRPPCREACRAPPRCLARRAAQDVRRRLAGIGGIGDAGSPAKRQQSRPKRGRCCIFMTLALCHTAADPPRPSGIGKGIPMELLRQLPQLA